MRDHRAAVDSVSAYWNALVLGQETTGIDLDPGVAEAIRHFQALGAVPSSSAQQRIWQTVQAAAARQHEREDLMQPSIVLSRSRPPDSGIRSRAVLLPWRGRTHWLVVQLATAALVVLTLVASLLAVGPARIHRGSDAPAFVPAISATPATPATGETPVAEYLWQTKGGPDLPFNDPINPVIDPQGNLWVVDGRNSRFQIFAPDGTFLEVWGTPGSGEGQFDFADPALFGGYGQAAAVFDSAGNLYVADPANHRIQKFGPDRTFLTAWGGEGEEDGQFLALLGLAVDGQGRVYASDERRNNVQVFNSDGRFLTAWGDNDADAEWLPYPAAITVAPDGNLWIVHFREHRIQKVSPDGVILATWGDMGSDEGQFRNPSHVAVDEEGRVYVADWGNYRVQVFDSDGRFLSTWGTVGFGDGEFLAPNSLVLDGAGGVYVADDGSDRVQKFRLLPPLAP